MRTSGFRQGLPPIRRPSPRPSRRACRRQGRGFLVARLRAILEKGVIVVNIFFVLVIAA